MMNYGAGTKKDVLVQVSFKSKSNLVLRDKSLALF
jgi:hypothetical protein